MLKKMLDRSEVGLAGIGFDLAAAVLVATALGWWIDRRFDTEPWGLIVCAGIGIVGGLLNFVRAGRKVMQRRSRSETLEGHDADEKRPKR